MAFVRNIKSVVTIDGKDREFVLRPLSYEQGVELMEASDALPPGVSDKKKHRAQAIAGLKLLPEAVISITPPVLDSEGQEVTIADMAKAMYFSDPLRDVVSDWIVASKPTTGETAANPTSSGESSPAHSQE